MIALEQCLRVWDPLLSSNCCIYKVRKKLRELNEAAYTPRIVSIGSFHNGKEGLAAMEEHKIRYLDKFLRRLPGGHFNDLVIYIKECEERVRFCYAETIELKDDNFLEMVILDACFIIELFLMNHYRRLEDENVKILKKSLFRGDIRDDLLLLLENQLPFFLLQGLYNIAHSTASNPISFLKLTYYYFSYYNHQNISTQVEEVKHFTDLLRTFQLSFLKSERCSPKDNKKIQFSKSATELHEAGVKFKAGSSKCLFDIQFTDGVLEIPFVDFDVRTDSNFRNIMALEQCHYLEIDSFISYILLLDSLINTSKDVELLAQADIIGNRLGDNNQVASLVNRLTKGILFSGFYYTRLCENLNEYCKVPRNSYKATCRREYFSTPWRIVSTIKVIGSNGYCDLYVCTLLQSNINPLF